MRSANDGELFAGEVKVEVRFSADCVDSDFIAPLPSTVHCSEVGVCPVTNRGTEPGRGVSIPRASGIVKMKDFADHKIFPMPKGCITDINRRFRSLRVLSAMAILRQLRRFTARCLVATERAGSMS